MFRCTFKKLRLIWQISLNFVIFLNQALEQQKLERQAATELERRRDQAFADRLLVTEQRVQLMERDVQRSRKETTMSVQVETYLFKFVYWSTNVGTRRNTGTRCRRNI